MFNWFRRKSKATIPLCIIDDEKARQIIKDFSKVDIPVGMIIEAEEKYRGIPEEVFISLVIYAYGNGYQDCLNKKGE